MTTTHGIQAVPKRYAQTLFRSTLEADWAATLDSLKIAWEYEPEAIQLPSGDHYRPDFYLPECATWLEVKGPHDERIGKTRELADVAEHHPDCETNMAGRPLKIVTNSDDHERAIEHVIANAPIGDSQITVQSFRSEGDRVSDRKTYKPKRRVALTRALLAGLREAQGGHDHADYEDGWNHGWWSPWRLVVIGRPAIRSCTAFEDAGTHDLSIIKCSQCGKNSFFDNSGGWRCRRCGKGGKVYHGGSWGTPGEPFGDRTLPFVRAPHAGRIARAAW